MKLLLAHNFYRQSGGEDEVFLRENELLRCAGHEVLKYTAHNSEIAEGGIFGKAKMAARTLWAQDGVARLRSLLRRERPDLAHFHNTFPIDLSRCLLRLPARRNPRVLSQLTSSNRSGRGDAGGSSNSRNLARTGGCIHRLHGIFSSKVHQCWVTKQKDFRQTTLFS